MIRDLHEHYDQLTENEREAVNQMMREVFKVGRDHGLKLRGDDYAEQATDGLSELVIKSRKTEIHALNLMSGDKVVIRESAWEGYPDGHRPRDLTNCTVVGQGSKSVMVQDDERKYPQVEVFRRHIEQVVDGLVMGKGVFPNLIDEQQ